MHPSDPRWKTASNKPVVVFFVKGKELKIGWTFRLELPTRGHRNTTRDIQQFEQDSGKEAKDLTSDFLGTLNEADIYDFTEKSYDQSFWAEDGALVFEYDCTYSTGEEVSRDDQERGKKFLSSRATVGLKARGPDLFREPGP